MATSRPEWWEDSWGDPPPGYRPPGGHNPADDRGGQGFGAGGWMRRQGMTAGHQSDYPELFGPGGAWAGGGPQTINQRDFAATSFSGLPGWGSDFLQKVVARHGAGAFRGLNRAVRDLNDAPATIEGMRKDLNAQYTRDIGDPTTRAVASAIESAIGRGVGNSSMLTESLGGVGRELAGGAVQAHQAGNIWSKSAVLKNLVDRIQANAARAGLMGDLVGLGRYSETYNPSMMGMGFSPA